MTSDLIIFIFGQPSFKSINTHWTGQHWTYQSCDLGVNWQQHGYLVNLSQSWSPNNIYEMLHRNRADILCAQLLLRPLTLYMAQLHCGRKQDRVIRSDITSSLLTIIYTLYILTFCAPPWLHGGLR